MAFDILQERGTPLAKQEFRWRDLVGLPLSKMNDDAFTRIRVLLMKGIEAEALRFSHSAARMVAAVPSLQAALARIRRVEQHQATLVHWLLPADQSPLETTIAYEQMAVEVTASVAQHEPDPYMVQVYNFGLLEDVDHLFRFSALLDRGEAKDANSILQSYTDVIPGRPTLFQHRAPEDDLRIPYNRKQSQPITKLHALTILSAEQQTHDYYMNVGPLFSDPMARLLYAEIASIEEQHVTQYESIMDPGETWLEKWLLHEACEVYNYYACSQQESNPRIREIWHRFVDYELGHLHAVIEIFKSVEKRDPSEIVPNPLPEPVAFASQRDYVRGVLEREVDLRAAGPTFVPGSRESRESQVARATLNALGSPTETVAAGYVWTPGTELLKTPRPWRQEASGP